MSVRPDRCVQRNLSAVSLYAPCVLDITVAAHEVGLLAPMLPVMKASLKERRSALDSKLEGSGTLEKTSWKLFSEVEEEARKVREKIDDLLAKEVSYKTYREFSLR